MRKVEMRSGYSILVGKRDHTDEVGIDGSVI
jgi:hypothetical protein